jgi:hypothetical protein
MPCVTAPVFITRIAGSSCSLEAPALPAAPAFLHTKAYPSPTYLRYLCAI